MHHNNKGMSLVEILIAIVISTIVITAAYASYSVIRSNYDFQQDMKYMSETARSVVKMIARDIRMAGYTDFDAVQITEAVKITDSTSKCCDRIDIIYDRSSSERVKISYYVQQYNNRHRLFKKIDKCTKSDCSTTSTLQSAQPIADYVEDLQFSGLKNGKVASTGAVEYGMGNKRWFTPDEIITIPWHGYQPWKVNECKKHMHNIHLAFDGNDKTVWKCPGISKVTLMLRFNKHVRIEKIRTGTSAHLGAGTYNGGDIDADYYRNVNMTYPYGTEYNIDQKMSFAIASYKAGKDMNDISQLDSNVHKCVTPPDIKYSGPNKYVSHKCEVRTGLNRYASLAVSGKDNILKVANSKKHSGAWEKCSGKCWNTSSYDHYFEYTATKDVQLNIDQPHRCVGYIERGKNSPCRSGYPSGRYVATELGELSFYGEVYGEPVIPTEVEIGLLLRSPNEFERNNKSFSISLGNRTFTSNDKYMRDSFSTSVIVRNLYYGNQ